MKRSYQDFLTCVRSTLLPLAEQGISPEEFKQIIVYLLSPYFVNQHILSELATKLLAPEAVNITRINSDAWTKEMFLKVLNEYREAAALNRAACFKGCADWENDIFHGYSEYMSIAHLEIDKSELSLEEFKYEVFRTVGALVEACQKSLLKELLLQVRIRRRKADPFRGLKPMKLGVAVRELYDTSGYAALFAPPPWGILLHQWRNMAQHHKTRVEDGKIIGAYAEGENEREVEFTRGELFKALRRIHSVYIVLRTARTIFVIDNRENMAPYIKDSVTLREDQKILLIASAIATQGFDLKDLLIEEETITAIVQDIAKPPSDKPLADHERIRMIHSSQFVSVAWYFFPLDTVTVKSLDKQEKLRLITVAKGSDCEAVSRGDIPFEELARRVDFVYSDLHEKDKASSEQHATS